MSRKVIWPWTQALSSTCCPAPLHFPAPVTAQVPTSCLPLPASAFTLRSQRAVGCPLSPSHTGEAVNRRAGQKSRGITKLLTHREGDKGPKSASSCLLVATFPMTVSSPQGMDERATSPYSAAIPSPPSHADAQGGSFRPSTALPRR